jgi:nucleotide-binding universal stress UspA family protein
VLVALDGSSIAEQALPLAAALSKHWNAPLRLVHVRNPVENAPGIELLHIDNRDWLPEEIRRGDYLRGIAESLRGSNGLSANSEAVTGVSIANTLRSISGTDTRALVMVRPRRSLLSRFWWGSVTNDLIGRLTVPLLIIPEAACEGSSVGTAYDGGFSQLLVHIDGTDGSATVVENALAMASPGAVCHLLRVLPLASAYATLGGGSARLSDIRADAWRELFRARDKLEEHGIACKSRLILDGQAAGSAIVDQARASQAQLIVVAARQHLLPWWLRDGVAEYVVRHANVPVLIVPSEGNLAPQRKTNHVDIHFN